MAFSAHTERRHLPEVEGHLATADTCIGARVELLQRMPIFGGIRADILQFLLGLCPVVSVLKNEFFFREHDEADSMFVLEAGKVAVVKSWGGQEYVLSILKEGDCFGEMAVMDHFPRSASIRAVEDCTAIRLSAANLYQVYELSRSTTITKTPLLANNSAMWNGDRPSVTCSASSGAPMVL